MLFSISAYSETVSAKMESGTASQGAMATQWRMSGVFDDLPLSFEENLGQTDPSVKYFARGNHYGFYFTSKEAVLSLQKDPGDGKSTILRMKMVGGNPKTRVVGMEGLPG